jgi:predicted RNA-binding Zn ribbon-like protein
LYPLEQCFVNTCLLEDHNDFERVVRERDRMAAEVKESRPFLFLGNALWLDFVNTEIISGGERADLLRSEADLWAWLAQAGALETGNGPSETDGERLLGRARDLRTSLRSMADQVTRGDSVSEEVVEAINGVLRLRQGNMQLCRDGDIWRQEFRSEDTGGDTALLPVAQSAAELLSAGEWRLVRRCEGPKCILYFYDTSKNHKRRWCSMAGCGNRIKAAEHYRRNRHQDEKTAEGDGVVFPQREAPTG